MRHLLLLFVLVGPMACDDAAPGAPDAAATCLGADCRDAAARECDRNADCPPGQGCDPTTWTCVADGRACVDRGDCLAGEACVDGLCRLPTGEPDAAPSRDASPDGGPLDAAPRDLAPPRDLAGPDLAVPDMAELDHAVPDQAVDMADPDQALDLAAPEPDQAVDMAAPDQAVDMAIEPDLGPMEPPPRGVYAYTRLPVGGLSELRRVAFHPQGDYALALEQAGSVYVVDWATGEATPIEPDGRGTVYWTGLAWVDDGARAVLVGSRFDDDAWTGEVHHFDHGAWAAGEPALSRSPDADRPGEEATAISVGPDGVPVVLLSRRVGGGYNAILRDYDPAARAWGALNAATVTRAGCGGLAHVRDEFGGVGKLVTCGVNGADLHLHRTLGGVDAWVARPGVGNIGNLGGVAAHPSLDYALVISWSGRRVHRFEGGRLLPSDTAPNYSRQGIADVVFQPNGRRALVVGRAGVQPVRGTVIEFRHDLYRCPAVNRDCDLTEVSIPGFDQPPYNGDGNHRLNHAAFHPGCDGGLLVGGYTAFRQEVGYLIRFEIEDGRACP